MTGPAKIIKGNTPPGIALSPLLPRISCIESVELPE
jgi:hypothetical protein